MSRRHQGDELYELTRQERRAHAKSERRRVNVELLHGEDSEPGVEWKTPRHKHRKPQPPRNEKAQKFWKNRFWKRRTLQRHQRAQVTAKPFEQE